MSTDTTTTRSTATRSTATRSTATRSTADPASAVQPTAQTQPTQPTQPSQRRAATRAGRVLSGLIIAFLTFDFVGKLLQLQPVVEGTVGLGFSASSVVPIGVMLGVAVVLFAIPRTTFLGALFITAYLGGAVCANFRAELPIAGYVLSPVYVAVVMWAGLFLRSGRLRALLANGR